MNNRVTIKDISKEVGVSTTTVARALSGKPKVGDDVRQAILDTVKRLGYRPNKTAQALVRKAVTIGIVYHKKPEEFQRYLEDGLRAGINDLSDYKVNGLFKPINDLNSPGEVKKSLDELCKKCVDGIILSTGFYYDEYKDLVEDIIHKGIPVLYLLTEIKDVKGIGCVKMNGDIAGRMAAQFLKISIKSSNKPVVILTSNKELSIHRECIDGFIKEAKKIGLNIKGIYETLDDKRIAYYITEKVLEEIPDLGGIYVTSYNSVGVCNCIEKNYKQDDVIVIGQDLYPELVEKLEIGSLKASLFQDPYEQAKTSINKIWDYITESTKSVGDILTTPILIMNANIGCYKDKYQT